jgi:hypothetical protein
MPTPPKHNNINTNPNFLWGFGSKGHVGGVYSYSFNTQMHTDEISGTGNHTTALFWEYDTRLGRRWNLDPVVEFSTSPYSTFLLNPILFPDPFGDTVDPSKVYEKDKETGEYKNPELIEAFEAFAQTKEGQEFIGMYAEKGQTIAGITYDKDGIYHKQGIDLSYTPKNLNKKGLDGFGANGNTEKPTLSNDGRWKINININSALNTWNNDAAQNYENNPRSKTARNAYSADRATTFVHESFIHAELFTKDILDNKKVDYSNIDSDIKKRYGVKSYQHYQTRKNDSYYYNKGWNANISIHNKFSTGKSKEQIWNEMWEHQH